MAKTSIIQRELKRGRLVNKYRPKRLELKKIIKKSKDSREVEEAQIKLNRLPVNSCPARHTSRCQQCGRARAVYKKFGLCRICLRKYLMTGDVAGATKSSW